MRLSHTLVLASTNRDKYEEFRTLLAAYPELELAPASSIMRNADHLAFVERFDTYAENAIAKARFANRACHYPALADDSGLEVEGLEGKPGVRSHRYAPPPSGALNAKSPKSQDQANIDKLLLDLGRGSRNARFVCHLALAIEGILIEGTGVLEGTIHDVPKGTHGFGYDPIFIPKGSSKTFAEMTDSEKNMISHRSKALHDLMAKVKAHGVTFAKP